MKIGSWSNHLQKSLVALPLNLRDSSAATKLSTIPPTMQAISGPKFVSPEWSCPLNRDVSKER